MRPAADSPAEERALATQRMARRIRRITLVLAIVLLGWLWLTYGGRWVPAKMDTVPDIPPGSFCVVDKRPATVQVGSHVFVELSGSGVVLSRVSAREGDRIRILHPNASSSLPDSRTLGEVPVEAVLGTVLGAFKPGGGDASGR